MDMCQHEGKGANMLQILAERGAESIVDLRSPSRKLKCSQNASDYADALQALGAAGVQYTCIDLPEGDDAQAIANEVLPLMRPLGIQAVINGSYDDVVEVADLISERLCPETTNGYRLSEARHDKARMHEVVDEAGLRSLRSVEVHSYAAAVAHMREGRAAWPVVLKPRRAGGTFGVSVCHNEDELRSAIENTIGKTNPLGGTIDTLLLQPYVRGTEYVVNVASRNGTQVTDAWMSQKKCSGSLILYQREDLVRSSSDVQGVVDYVKQTLDALGIRNGPSHTEVMRTDEGEVVLLEVNPRFQGCRPHARDAAALGRSAFEAVADSFLRPAIFMAEAEKPYTSEKAVCQLFLACPCEQAGALNKEMLSLIACLPTFVTFNRELYPLNRFCPRQGEREWFSRTGRVVFPPIRCKGRTTYLLNSPGVILLSDADATRLEADYDLIRRNERGLYLPVRTPVSCLALCVDCRSSPTLASHLSSPQSTDSMPDSQRRRSRRSTASAARTRRGGWPCATGSTLSRRSSLSGRRFLSARSVAEHGSFGRRGQQTAKKR